MRETYLQKFLLKELSIVDFIGATSCAAVTCFGLQLWSLFRNLQQKLEYTIGQFELFQVTVGRETKIDIG